MHRTIGPSRAHAVVVLATSGLFASSLVVPSPARACGGLFCDGVQPVVQTNENILFVERDEPGTVTAVVQILYQGPPDSFAWVVPVPGVPEISVSSDVAFQRLSLATAPQYNLTTEVRGECASAALAAAPPFSCGCAGDELNSFDFGDDVQELQRGEVGPYDYTLLDVSDAPAGDPAALAFDWLEENGYSTTGLDPELITPYLEGGMNLLAFKLTKDSDAGDIRPVVMTYRTERPMIPIKLTQVAATPNLGVLVWVGGPARAVPLNYRALELNDARINWFNPMATYNDLIDEAADEAGSHGFVTEKAGPSGPDAAALWTDEDEQHWSRVLEGSPDEHYTLLHRLWRAFDGVSDDPSQPALPPWDGLREALRTQLPEDSFVDPLAIYQNPEGYPALVDAIDGPALLEEVRVRVVEPVLRTRDLLAERPFLTRLYTTLDPVEMTVDPVFDFNPDLSDVSNVHEATRIVECHPLVGMWEVPWTATLPSGEVLVGNGQRWPDHTAEAPANRLIRQLDVSGPGEIIVDNSGAIAEVVAHTNAEAIRPLPAACLSLGRRAGSLYELAVILLALGLGRALLRRAGRAAARPRA